MKKFLKLIAVGLMTVLTVAMLLACAPSNLDKAEDKLKDEGYTIIFNTEINKDGVVGTISAVKGIFNGDAIVAVLYESASDAKDAIGDYEDEVKDGQNIWQEGKWIIIATEDAYEDFMD